jgi:Fur family peroxide stress response transcriptional regulator
MEKTIQALKNQGFHLTRQRLLVLEILTQFPGHPDAGAIFQEAKKRDDRISLATVYRSLAVLKSAGLVDENRLGEDHGHFETFQKSAHHHFTCLSCGTVIEFKAPRLAKWVAELSEKRGLRVTETRLNLHGYCPGCQDEAGKP